MEDTITVSDSRKVHESGMRIVSRSIRMGYYSFGRIIKFAFDVLGDDVDKYVVTLRHSYVAYYNSELAHKPKMNINEALGFSDADLLAIKRQAIQKAKPRIISLLKKGEVRDVFTKDGVSNRNETLMNGGNVPYMPRSQSPAIGTVVPASMAYESELALAKIEEEVGNFDDFIMKELEYENIDEMYLAFSSEQIDALVLAIYNIEKGEAMIVGDQAGVGKGRVAAGIIRYAIKKGHKPIFITQKTNLFSDFYRDLRDIGFGHIRPFIFNDKEPQGGFIEIKEEYKNPLSENGVSTRTIHKSFSGARKTRIIESKTIPEQSDFVIVTYSQFMNGGIQRKRDWLTAVSVDNILVMDESHTASGKSKKLNRADRKKGKLPSVGDFFKGLMVHPLGITFLSATFAKRASNMPLYALRTSISAVDITSEELVMAIERGGVAMQEILASELVASGQMIRRERSMEDVEVNYITIGERNDGKEEKAIRKYQYDTMDVITEFVNKLIYFQEKFIDPTIGMLDLASENKIENHPYSSRTFQIINQALFAIKAEEVAVHAVQRLKEGKRVIVAASNTMEASYKRLNASIGDEVPLDFTMLLKDGLKSTLNYTEKDADENKQRKVLYPTDLSEVGRMEYDGLASYLDELVLNLTSSPIDKVREVIEAAGYSFREITGRSYNIDSSKKEGLGFLRARQHRNTIDNISAFNDGSVDVLLLNAAGATGASMHSSEQFVDQRQRVMLMLQSELNIDVEVQKRGRVDRTGQMLPPIYDYLTSSIPAENRLLMMLKNKLSSLDANTTSDSTMSSDRILKVVDFVNRYGDRMVTSYLVENPEVNEAMHDPLYLEQTIVDINRGILNLSDIEEKAEGTGSSDDVTKKISIMPTKMQENFYTSIILKYQEYIDYLDSIGENKLKLDYLPLEAETKLRKIIQRGDRPETVFGGNTYLEHIKTTTDMRPMKIFDIKNHINNILEDYSNPAEYSIAIGLDFYNYYKDVNKRDKLLIDDEVEEKLKTIVTESGKLSMLEEANIRVKIKSLFKEKANRINNNYRAMQALGYLFSWFWVGRVVKVPFSAYQTSLEDVSDGVFLGYHIDKHRNNPYLPSAVLLEFAVNDSRKKVRIPLSKKWFLDSIGNMSKGILKGDMEKVMNTWDNADIFTGSLMRYMVTGNVLQGYTGEFIKGKLVSFSTSEGKIKNGILMPEKYLPNHDSFKMKVRIKDAYTYINGLQARKMVMSSCGTLLITRNSAYSFTIELMGEKRKHGKYLVDYELVSLSLDDEWKRQNYVDVIRIGDSQLEEVLIHLDSQHKTKIMISSGGDNL